MFAEVFVVFDVLVLRSENVTFIWLHRKADLVPGSIAVMIKIFLVQVYKCAIIHVVLIFIRGL